MDAADAVRRPPFGDNPLVGERGASTRRKILQSALEVFAQHGFHDTRVELITEAAGCSRPAFYQYFSSKEEVFWHLAGRLAREMDHLADNLEAIAPDESGLEPVRVWIEGMVDLQEAYAPVFASFQAAAREASPAARASRGINERIGDNLIRSVGGDHPELEIHALAGATATMLLRAIHYWRLGLGQLPRKRFVAGLTQTAHRLLHGPIEGVNVGPVVKPPTKRARKWPEFPGTNAEDRDLRPRGQKTRQKLLDAGSAVLPVRGYHDTRVDDIVEAAGVSHGSFYRYFQNKDDLFHVLAENAALQMVELVQSFPEDAASDQLSSWLHGWFSSYRENGGVISAWQEINYDDPELAAFSLDIAVVVFDRLVRIVHRRRFGDVTVDGLALLSVIERLPYNVLALQYLEEDEAVDASVFLIRRGVLGIDQG